jgi:hypothetical protein
MFLQSFVYIIEHPRLQIRGYQIPWSVNTPVTAAAAINGLANKVLDPGP